MLNAAHAPESRAALAHVIACEEVNLSAVEAPFGTGSSYKARIAAILLHGPFTLPAPDVAPFPGDTPLKELRARAARTGETYAQIAELDPTALIVRSEFFGPMSAGDVLRLAAAHAGYHERRLPRESPA
ncbi:MAG: hypothetical protein C4321_00895 [Chloroflexota bacterium]